MNSVEIVISRNRLSNHCFAKVTDFLTGRSKYVFFFLHLTPETDMLVVNMLMAAVTFLWH